MKAFHAGLTKPAFGPRRLLIVDDDPRLCRALSRSLACSVDTLRAASTPEEAHHWLAKEAITHLICDHNLGDGVPKGEALVEKWRREHRSIERAVLYTGAHLDKSNKPSCIDAIVFKTASIDDLMQSLGLKSAG